MHLQKKEYMLNWISRIVLFFSFCLTTNILAQPSNYIINDIQYTGYKKNKLSYLKKFVQASVGQPLNLEQLKKDENHLEQLVGVYNADVKIDTLKQNQVNLTFQITEQRTLLPIFGIGGIKDNFWYQLGVSEYNFRGRSQTLLAYFLSNDKVPNGKIYFQNDRINGGDWGFAIDLQRTGSIEPLFFPDATVVYTYKNTGIGGSIFRSIDYDKRVDFGMTFFREDYEKNMERNPLPNSPGPEMLIQDKLLLKLGFNLNHIGYDYFYRTGTQMNILSQYVLNVDDKSEFISIAFEGKKFWRPYPTTNFAAKLRVAFASNNDSPFAPFVVDSQTNIRGVGNRVDRGTGQLVLNLELRQTLIDHPYWASQLVIFSDLGTWRNPGGTINDFIDPDLFRQFVGGGIRFINKKIHRAIVRIDYGVDIFNMEQRGIVVGIGQYF